jgi:hypothetical protein
LLRFSFLNHFSFTATQREIEKVRKIEMAREMDIGKEIERGGDGDR